MRTALGGCHRLGGGRFLTTVFISDRRLLMATRHASGAGTASIARIIAGGAVAAALMVSTSLTMAQETPVEIPQGQNDLFS
jgi:uncharacterized membrane protein YhfC